MFNSVKCNTEFWSQINCLHGYSKVPTKDSFFFQLGLNGSGLGLMIFHKMSPRAHNYL